VVDTRHRPRIVVLGGGVGGTLTANLLARRLGTRAQVTLVDRTGLHIYQPSFLYAAFRPLPTRSLGRDLRSLLRRDIRLVVDEVTTIDPASRTAGLRHGQNLEYDFLVIALGSQLAPERIPGLAEGSHNFYSLAGAQRLHTALHEFSGGTVLVGVAGIPYKCPPAPIEFTFLLDDYLRRRGLRSATTIRFLSPLNRAFTIASASRMIEPIFEERRIELHTFVNVAAVDPEKHIVTTLEDETYDYDLAVIVPPHTTPAVLRNAGLTDGDWVPVDRQTLAVRGQENVYAIGDCTDLPISKAGSTAHFEARVVAERITAAVEQRPVDPTRGTYHGKVMCFLETGGGKATYLVFDYDHEPRPPQPSRIWHLGKAVLNQAYWVTVPQGRL